MPTAADLGADTVCTAAAPTSVDDVVGTGLEGTVGIDVASSPPNEEPGVRGVKEDDEKATSLLESKAVDSHDDAEDDGSGVDEVVASLKNAAVQDTEDEGPEDDPALCQIFESSLIAKTMMQFEPYLDLRDEPEPGGVQHPEEEKAFQLTREVVMDRVKSGHQPLIIGFQAPIGEEIKALASLISVEGAAVFECSNWVSREVFHIVKRVESASYQALVAFFHPTSDRVFTKADAKLCAEEIKAQWPGEMQLSLDQFLLLHTAIQASGADVQYHEIKSLLRHIGKTMAIIDVDAKQLADSVKEFETSHRTKFPLFESSTIFSNLSESDLVQLRYTLYKLPTVIPGLLPALNAQVGYLFQPCEHFTLPLLRQKIRSCGPEDADLSPSARKLVADIITVFGPKLTIESVVGFLGSFRPVIFLRGPGNLLETPTQFSLEVDLDSDAMECEGTEEEG